MPPAALAYGFERRRGQCAARLCRRRNAFFPKQEGVASVDRYVRYYLFNDYKDGKGGMQMTEKEPNPYGIYGTFDNWWQHRAAPDTPPDTYEPSSPNRLRDWTVLHRDHLWRIYD